MHAHDYVVVPLTTGTLRLEEAEGVREAELIAGCILCAPRRRRAQRRQCQQL